MAKKVIKTPKSTTSSSTSSSSTQSSTSSSKGTTSNVSTNNSSSISNGTTSQTSTQTGVNNTNGGSHNMTYKDLSGLSDETKYLQDYTKNNYTFNPSESQKINQAENNKLAAENAYKNYGTYNYNSNVGDALTETLNKIMNRKEFTYDFDKDALYKQFKESYDLQGRQAAENAVAQSAALTGGYGNSYGTSAAAQATQQYMTQLNDKIPELYQLALNKYNVETSDLYNMYNALGAQDDRDFNQYNTKYNADMDRLSGDRNYYNSDYYNIYNQEQQNHQNTYQNAMDLLNYRTNLEAKDVTDGSNWSTTNTSEKGTQKGKTYEKTKNTGKQTDKQTTTQKNTETTKTNQSSSTNSVSVGSGGSSGTKSKKNNTSGTTTKDSVINKVLANFEKIEKANTNNYKAIEYLYSTVDGGLIKPKDFDYIVKLTGAKVPKQNPHY